MNKNNLLDQIQDFEGSASELDAVIDTNKELFNQLNTIPEIEALDSISIEEDEYEVKRDKPNPIIELFNRVQVFYTENELTR